MRFLLRSALAVMTLLQSVQAAPSWSLYTANLCTLFNEWQAGFLSTTVCEATCEAKGYSFAETGVSGSCSCGSGVFLCGPGPGINVYQLGSESGSWSVDATNTDCAPSNAWLGVQSASACQSTCSSFFYAIQGPDGNCKCASALSSCSQNTGSTVYGRTPATPAWNNYLSNTDCFPSSTWTGVAASAAACEASCAASGLIFAEQRADGNCKCGSAPTGCQTTTGSTIYQLSPLVGVGSNWQVVASNTDCATSNTWLGVQSASACQTSCASFFYAIQRSDGNCKCASTLSSCVASTGSTVYAPAN